LGISLRGITLETSNRSADPRHPFREISSATHCVPLNLALIAQ
jgi:hypothetical protein